jgi:hypothetical protein
MNCRALVLTGKNIRARATPQVKEKTLGLADL